MALIDTERAEQLYAAMGPAHRDLGRLGGEHDGRASRRSAAAAAFIGRVADDQLGAVFGHDLRAAGVRVRRPRRRPTASPTGRCLIIVTPDAERTMNTYLGASAELGPTTSTPSSSRGAQVALPRGLPLGRARGEGRVPPRRRASRTTPATGSRSRCPTRSASTATATSSSSSSSTTSTSCSPTRPRSPRSTRSTTSTPRCSACTTTARSPRSPAARRAR